MNYENVRLYGSAPYRTVLVHGGPGAVGEMAAVARELASSCGLVEALQTMLSVDSQIEELKAVINAHADLPVTLVGHSWGAWLAFMLAARYPELVRKLILIGSAPFTVEYADTVEKTRLNRLGDDGIIALKKLLADADDPDSVGHNHAIEAIGALFASADDYDPFEYDGSDIEFRQDIFHSVWPEAAALRQNGKLISFAEHIQCPVLALHGDYDPHPAAGVTEPLAAHLQDFRFILLEKCGHKPWLERHARDHFFELMNEEIK